MGKLDGKVAVITGASTGMALAGAQLFVAEGAHVFIQARRQDALDDAVLLIGRNVTAIQGDASDLADLDRLYDTVKQEKGSIDVLWASAGMGEPGVLGEITEDQYAGEMQARLANRSGSQPWELLPRPSNANGMPCQLHRRGEMRRARPDAQPAPCV